MGKPSAPTPPDPKVTAGAQTAQNTATAITQQQLNQTNQVTPYGSLTYNQTGTYQHVDPNTGKTYDIPTYTATQTLSPGQQAIHDQNQKASLNLARLGANQSGRLGGLLARPMNLEGLPQRGDPSKIDAPQLGHVGAAGDIRKTYGGNFSEDRQRVEETLMARMNPNLQRDRSALEARLASQGIRIGSEAYSSAMGDLGRKENDARMSAILGAGQEQSRLVGMEAQRAGFENAAQQQGFAQQMARTGLNNQAALQGFNAGMAKQNAQSAARASALQEAFAVRNQPINEITALMSGAQVQNPNFVNGRAAQMANTDYAGLVNANHNQKMGNYQAQMNSWNNTWGGVLGLGASLLSDRRTKTDIRKIGETDDGQKIYSYRYKTGGPTQIGLMAQEVEKRKPDAVTQVNGLKMVNYEKATR